MMDVDTAVAMMWSQADKPERMPTLHKIAMEIGFTDATKFWKEFWQVWSSSESLFRDSDFIGDLVAYGQQLGSPLLGLDDEEREALEAMPSTIVVWRGASSFNQDGWSWTTDKDKAEWFAGRAYGSKERFVVKAMVQRDHVIGYLTGRSEAEIVVHPDDLIDQWVEKQWTEQDLGHAMYFAVQTGMLNDGGMEEARAAMMLLRCGPDQRASIASQIDQCLPFCEWAGLSRGQFYKAAKKILSEEKQNAG